MPTFTVQSGYRAPSSSSAVVVTQQDARQALLQLLGEQLSCCGLRSKGPKPPQPLLGAPSSPAETAPTASSPSSSANPSQSPDSAAEQRRQCFKRGLAKFIASDPRRLICDFMRPGDSRGPQGFLRAKRLVRRSRVLEPDDSQFFGVFRPTSLHAFYMMMMGRATGKALNIKGKSAKTGELSGFVPFLQIDSEADKKHVRTCERHDRVRVFYRTPEARDEAFAHLAPLLLEMLEASEAAQKRLRAYEEGTCTLSADERRAACACQRWAMGPPGGARHVEPLALIERIDDGDETVGLELPMRLLWEAYVVRQDISHTAGGFGHTGRPSEPAYQNLNVHSLVEGDAPQAVLWQYDTLRPLNPRGLLMAHEEDRVRPVASDVDTFLVGSRGVTYKPMAPDQLEIMRWQLEHIEQVLATPRADGWMARWLDVLKRAADADERFSMEAPTYGFGDPTSYSVIEAFVSTLQLTGAVRHGAECFNFYIPQELDDEYLVIWDGFERLPLLERSKVPWQYVTRDGLRHFLSARIAEGYALPLNPKWCLCDGWYGLFEQLLQSDAARQAVDAWYPPGSGLRERMAAIHSAHPNGFVPDASVDAPPLRPLSAGEAEYALRRHQVLQRAKRKLRAVAAMMRLYRAKHARRSLRRALTRNNLVRRLSSAPQLRTDSPGADEDEPQ